MTDALRYEWVRIRTLRSTYWLVGLALVLSAGVAFVIALATRNEPVTPDLAGAVMMGSGGLGAGFLPIFMAIVGVLAIGHEYRYGTIQPTLTAIPQRSTLLTAKVVVVIAVALVAAGVSVVVNTLLGTIFWGELPGLTDAPLNEAIPGYFVQVTIYAALGLALALLFRGVPSAIVVLLVTPLIVEGLITGLSFIPALEWLQDIVPYLPFGAGDRLTVTDAFDTGEAEIELLSRWAGGGVFALFMAVILAVGWYRFQTRDA
ncbi:MAG TPA: ABC transporter permease subunit [Jiangellaceae bacterium]